MNFAKTGSGYHGFTRRTDGQDSDGIALPKGVGEPQPEKPPAK
jgi:hypothetical protein